MGDVFRFPEPMTAGGQMLARALDRAAFRAELEAAAREALDAADRIIAALDRLDDNPDLEDDREATAVRGALEGQMDQIAWLRGARPDVEIAPSEQR